jgi:hypothetical protein
MTATQAIYDMWACNLHNETYALFILDLPSALTGSPGPNSIFGPNAFYHDQFSSLFGWRNIGTSDYNALQATYTIHTAKNLQAQFNYTWSKSLDEASDAERIGPYQGTGGTGNDLNGGGIVINTWSPYQLRGLSDFNTTHQLNANWMYNLPFGKDQAFAPGATGVLNALIGGWQFSGLGRWTSGFPITVDNGFSWATNWNIEGDANLVGALPQMQTTPNAIVGGVGQGPNMFPDPVSAYNSFRPDWPGESGIRNVVIGDGMFNIDTGLSKTFNLTESKTLQFSWQTFNVTNTVRYNVRSLGNVPSLSNAQTFGNYTQTLTQPRFMQFALRLSF